MEALLLALLDGHHALYQVGARWEARGMLPLLQTGRQRASRHDDRLGQILDAWCAAHRNRVLGTVALKAWAVYAIPTPWLHQETTTLALDGADAAERAGRQAPQALEGPVPPRPA